MAKKLTFYNVAGLNKTLRALPRTASANLRDASQVIADKVAQDAAATPPCARAQTCGTHRR
jgi:hypothetical protein